MSNYQGTSLYQASSENPFHGFQGQTSFQCVRQFFGQFINEVRTVIS